GNLAPNTQYQVTIGPGARTQAGQPLATPQTITFVTQPPAPPTPSPTARPTPSANALGEKQLTGLNGASSPSLQWSADSSSIYYQGANGPKQLAALPTTGTSAVLSIAPDATHVIYRQDKNLFLLNVASAKSTQLGQAGAGFIAWSPGGAYLLYSTNDATVVSDADGVTQSTIPSGEASWSTQDAILVGGDTALYQVRSDGTGGTQVSSGTY